MRRSKIPRRQADEQEINGGKPRAADGNPGNAWKCADCCGTFISFPYKDESTDGQKPQCCPYCGVIFRHFTEFVTGG